MRILYTSKQIRDEIVRLFSDSAGRRVAVSAYVGQGAEAFLPNPNGLEIYCWPQPGGTNPAVIRRLIKRGAIVYFVDRLHMKLYWTPKGTVITSANLSTNALGSGNLQEIGAFIPVGGVDIDRIVRNLDPRLATQEALRNLDRKTHAFATGRLSAPQASRLPAYKQWYESPYRPSWKLDWFVGDTPMSKNARAKALQDYGSPGPYASMTCATANELGAGDWVMLFDWSSSTPKMFYWMMVDFVVHIARTDKRSYFQGAPYQAVQVFPLRRYPQPPFKIDARFRAAFRAASRHYGSKALERRNSTRVPAKLLDLIRDYY